MSFEGQAFSGIKLRVQFALQKAYNLNRLTTMDIPFV